MKQSAPDTFFRRRLLPAAVLSGVILFISFAGITAARYMAQHQKAGIASAQDFYFTSDLLKENPPEGAFYYMDPEAGSFQVNVYNYADSQRTTSADIRYTYTIVNGTDGSSGSEGSGLLQGGVENTGLITVYPIQGSSDVTVTVTASSPYKKTLTATFKMTLGNQYLVEDHAGDTAAVLIITCTDSARDIPLLLPGHVIPDATDDRVVTADGSYIFKSPGSGVYSLVLLKLTPSADLSRDSTLFAGQINLQ
ncbi:hypothetical protein [Clostridium transplantifaecale]|uniref:hypothetical protein n=1 Tax=Clostridium transplantifaecale TaxID=2479838 RepID=UPI000F640B63|nr:hypothetical protein [Clostridium transplantifaecale]